MGDELVILHQVTERLESAGIEYMVTGSLALSVYAEPRMTRDIDLVVALGPVQAERLITLFESEFHLDADRIRDRVRRGGMFNMIHTSTIVKVDCVVRKGSEYRKTEFERRRRLPLAGQDVYVVAPEDLVLSKLDWARDSGSEQQLRDVRSLLSMATLDWDYVRLWADRLDLRTQLEEAGR